MKEEPRNRERMAKKRAPGKGREQSRLSVLVEFLARIAAENDYNEALREQDKSRPNS
ncbi:MAG: hypothetical protein H6862_02880 [Rhodospirillales bacterium]|nr:hypothetical protein [Rhodospirillales bacterium]